MEEDRNAGGSGDGEEAAPAGGGRGGPPAAPGEFRYDAFISYRHTEPDRAWAKWLHGALETYRVPGKLARDKGLAGRLRRVFRDEEELPASNDLSREIDTALEQSRFLVVVCSPNTPKSEWVNAEVKRFRELGRNDRILALLIAGEPSESFPRALCEIRRTVVDASGSSVEVLEEVEPLAADVRSTRPEGGAYLKRMAKLRLLACILGCRFDDLRQREQERRAKRTALAAALLGILLLAMTGLAAWAVLEAEKARKAEEVAASERDLARKAQRDAEAARGEAQASAEVARAEREKSERDLYNARIHQAKTAFDLYDLRRAREHLESCEERFRHFEWGFLKHQCDQAYRTLRGHTKTVWQLAWSPDGRRLVTSDGAQVVKVWDWEKGTCVRTLKGCEDRVVSLAWPEGQRILCACEDGNVVTFDSETGAESARFHGPAGPLLKADFSRDGRFLALCAGFHSVGQDGLDLWDTASGTIVSSAIRQEKGIRTAAFSGDGKLVAAGGHKGSLSLWDWRGGKRTDLEGHTEGLCLMEISADSSTLFSFGDELALSAWDVESGLRWMHLKNFDKRVRSLCLKPDMTSFAIGHEDGSVRLWDVQAEKPFRELSGHTSIVWDMAYSADGSLLATCSQDRTVKIWNLKDSDERFREYHTNPASTAFSASADGRAVAFETAEGVFRILEDVTGRLLAEVKAYPHDYRAFSLSGDGRRMVFLNEEGQLSLHDASTDAELRRWSVPSCRAQPVALRHDGEEIAVGAPDGSVALRNAGSGLVRIVLKGNPEWVEVAAYSPDGTRLLSGGAGGEMRLWDASTGALLGALKGYTSRLCNAAFSPDGLRVVAATYEDVSLFSTETCREMMCGMPGANFACFVDGGTRIASLREWTEVRLLEGSLDPPGPGSIAWFRRLLPGLPEEGVPALFDRNPGLTAARAEDGATALHAAAETGSLSSVKACLDRSMPVDLQDNSGRTALHLAAREGRGDVVLLLLGRGARADLQDDPGETPLHLAAFRADAAMTRAMLEGDPAVDRRNAEGYTPLQIALERKAPEVVGLLLEAGADLKVKGRYGATALHAAAAAGRAELLRLLLAKGAPVDALDDSSRTPLHLAARDCRGAEAEALAALLDAGADLEARDGDQRTPLHYTAWEGNLAGLRVLLERKAAVDVRDRYAGTPLHFAAQLNLAEPIELLLDHGADVNARNDRGFTPLSNALGAGKKDAERALRARGGTE